MRSPLDGITVLDLTIESVVDNANGQFADFNTAVSCATGEPETGAGPGSASGGRGAAPIVLALLAAIAGGALLAGG